MSYIRVIAILVLLSKPNIERTMIKSKPFSNTIDRQLWKYLLLYLVS